MAYQLNKTNGTVLTTLADSQIDQVSTDITLIGKNYSGFGEYLNENLVKMLENFANSSPPQHPIQGQLWFDSADLKLKIYTGGEFLPVSSAIFSNTTPTTPFAGDLWYDETKGQLFFFNGRTWDLLGPDWELSQGITGVKAENILDVANANKVILKLYCGSVLLGIFSKESFTPKNPIAGYTGPIIAGFNAGTLAGMKFNVTATNAEQLGGFPASAYIRTNQDLTVNGKVSILSNEGLTIGSSGQLSVTSDGSTVYFKAKASVAEDALSITPVTRTVEIYPGQTNSIVRIPGTLYVNNIEVAGSETIREVQTLVVTDKNILLASPPPGTPPTDIASDGGGMILRGDSNHRFTWSLDNVAWQSTEHINLSSGREYKINGVTVISENSLGASITSAPGITNFGVQSYVDIGEGEPLVAVMRLEGPKVRTLTIGGDLQLQAGPAGNNLPAGNISLVGSPRIVGLANPAQDFDAANKRYVDAAVGTAPIVFSMDISDNKDDNYIIDNVLNQLAPIAEHREGTIARILCTIKSIDPQQVNVNQQVTQTTEVFTKPVGTGLAVTSVSIAPVTIPSATVTITRIAKVFKILDGRWSLTSSTELPA